MWIWLGLDFLHSLIVVRWIQFHQCLLFVNLTWIRLWTQTFCSTFDTVSSMCTFCAFNLDYTVDTFLLLYIWYSFNILYFVWIALGLDCWHSSIVVHLIQFQQCLLCVNLTWIRLLTQSSCCTFAKFSTLSALCDFYLD